MTVLLVLLVTAASHAGSFDPFKGVRKETLPNGLTIITLKNDGPPLVSINFFINTGSINENENNQGVSHFCEHMFYRGTEDRTGEQMKTGIEKLGGEFNAETSKDYTRYYVNIPSEQGLEALRIYCDALMNAQYGESQMEQERKVILQEYGMSKDNPFVLLHGTLLELAFPGHPYQRPVIGTEKSIKSLTREDLIDYRSRFYRPANTAVVIVGNFDQNSYLRFLRDYFKDRPGGTVKTGGAPSCPPLEEKREKTVEVDGVPGSAFFALAFRSPSIREPEDVIAMDVLTFMMGKGNNSILAQELDVKRKLVREVSVEFQTSRDEGLVIIAGDVEPRNIEKLKESLFTVIHLMKKGKFSDEDLLRARNMLVKTYIYGIETNSGKADTLGFYQTVDRMEFGVGYINRVKGVTREDLVRTANKYFGDSYVFCTLKSRKDG
jgi:zinc protease